MNHLEYNMSRKQPLVLVLLGTGTVPSTKIIRTGIRDLLDSGKVEEIAIAWHGKDAALNTAFDILEEQEVPLFIYSEVKVPREVGALAEDVLVSDDYLNDILADSANRAKELSADCKLALLWDDDDEELMQNIVLAAAKRGISTLDLGNGLVPIMVEDDEPAKQDDIPVALVDDEDADETPVDPSTTPFSREELAAMPFAALKRMAIAQGKMLPAKPTKMSVIDVLLSDVVIAADEVEEPQKEVEVPKPAAPKPSAATPIVVVIYNDGSTTTITLSEKQQEIVRNLTGV